MRFWGLPRLLRLLVALAFHAIAHGGDDIEDVERHRLLDTINV